MSNTKVENSIIERFQEVLDLSLNEARVYYTLYLHPEGSASELSEFAELPRSRIYESLSKLAAKNLVEKNQISSGYRLIPPNESIENVIDDLDRSFDKKKQSLERMKEYLDDLWRGNISQETEIGVQLLPSHSIEQFIIKDIREMNDRMFIAAASSNPILDWSNIVRELVKKVPIEPEIKYLVFKEEMEIHLKSSLGRTFGKAAHLVEIKSNPDLYISFLLIDTIVYLFIFTTESLIQPMVLRSASSELTKALTWMFETLWKE